MKGLVKVAAIVTAVTLIAGCKHTGESEGSTVSANSKNRLIDYSELEKHLQNKSLLQMSDEDFEKLVKITLDSYDQGSNYEHKVGYANGQSFALAGNDVPTRLAKFARNLRRFLASTPFVSKVHSVFSGFNQRYGDAAKFLAPVGQCIFPPLAGVYVTAGMHSEAPARVATGITAAGLSNIFDTGFRKASFIPDEVRSGANLIGSGIAAKMINSRFMGHHPHLEAIVFTGISLEHGGSAYYGGELSAKVINLNKYGIAIGGKSKINSKGKLWKDGARTVWTVGEIPVPFAPTFAFDVYFTGFDDIGFILKLPIGHHLFVGVKFSFNSRAGWDSLQTKFEQLTQDKNLGPRLDQCIAEQRHAHDDH